MLLLPASRPGNWTVLLTEDGLFGFPFDPAHVRRAINTFGEYYELKLELPGGSAVFAALRHPEIDAYNRLMDPRWSAPMRKLLTYELGASGRLLPDDRDPGDFLPVTLVPLPEDRRAAAEKLIETALAVAIGQSHYAVTSAVFIANKDASEARWQRQEATEELTKLDGKTLPEARQELGAAERKLDALRGRRLAPGQTELEEFLDAQAKAQESILAAKAEKVAKLESRLAFFARRIEPAERRLAAYPQRLKEAWDVSREGYVKTAEALEACAVAVPAVAELARKERQTVLESQAEEKVDR